MRNLYGKVFKNTQTGEVKCFPYDPTNQNYYAFVQEANKSGFQQSIFTSSVMISIIEHFLFKHSAVLSEIEFLIEDELLNQEINNILAKMKDNAAFWSQLKERLAFLSRYDSIDIKKIKLKGFDDGGFLLTLRVNGIVVVSENAYNTLSIEISEIVRKVIN